MATYSEGVLVGYRWYDAKNIAPLYPFGYGLSYTTFAYSNLKLSAATLPISAPALQVDFDVANTGKVAGSEIAQLYVGLPSLPDVPQPLAPAQGLRPPHHRTGPDGARHHQTRRARVFLLGHCLARLEGRTRRISDLCRVLLARP